LYIPLPLSATHTLETEAGWQKASEAKSKQAVKTNK
jgi:hypothetical protein